MKRKMLVGILAIVIVAAIGIGIRYANYGTNAADTSGNGTTVYYGTTAPINYNAGTSFGIDGDLYIEFNSSSLIGGGAMLYYHIGGYWVELGYVHP